MSEPTLDQLVMESAQALRNYREAATERCEMLLRVEKQVFDRSYEFLICEFESVYDELHSLMLHKDLHWAFLRSEYPFEQSSDFCYAVLDSRSIDQQLFDVAVKSDSEHAARTTIGEHMQAVLDARSLRESELERFQSRYVWYRSQIERADERKMVPCKAQLAASLFKRVRDSITAELYF